MTISSSHNLDSYSALVAGFMLRPSRRFSFARTLRSAAARFRNLGRMPPMRAPVEQNECRIAVSRIRSRPVRGVLLPSGSVQSTLWIYRKSSALKASFGRVAVVTTASLESLLSINYHCQHTLPFVKRPGDHAVRSSFFMSSGTIHPEARAMADQTELKSCFVARAVGVCVSFESMRNRMKDFHCTTGGGLNEDEIEYSWERFSSMIHLEALHT